MDLMDGTTSFLKADEVDEAGQLGAPHFDLSQQLPPPNSQASALPASDTLDLRDRGIDQLNGPISFNQPPAPRDRYAPAPQQPPPPAPPIADASNPTDSLSLLQLRRLVSEMPRPEPTPYAFTYADASCFEEEVEEIFGYGMGEREALARVQDSFVALWHTFCEREIVSWITSDSAKQREFLARQRHQLRRGGQPGTLSATEALLYIALGCWHETATTESPIRGQSHASERDEQGYGSKSYRSSRHHVEAMIDGIDLIISHVGIETIYSSWCRAAGLQAGSDNEPGQQDDDSTDDENASDNMMWATTVLLYLLVDRAWRLWKEDNDLTLRTTILGLEPSLLKNLAKITTLYRWDESNTVPSSKLLLLLWKTILVTMGGLADIAAIRSTLSGRGKTTDDGPAKPIITASPLDYHVFRQELLSKYPAFDPPPPLFPFEPDSISMISPLQEPMRPAGLRYGSQGGAGPANINGTAPSILHQPVHIATPAPSPPPSPAGPGKGVKKHNYQTNQMFPFLYPPLDPRSNEAGGKGSTEQQDARVGRRWQGSDIPVSIQEAAALYANRMRATRAMQQLWEERADFLECERNGLPDSSDVKSDTVEDTTTKEGSKSTLRKSEKELNALPPAMRATLDRVDTFYNQCAGELPSMVVVLLRILLQTVTTLVTQPNNQTGLQGGYRANDGQIIDRSDTFDARTSSSMLRELDVLRTQEIMAKSVSGILILLLKWFKLSHVLKFEYLSQLLLDSNYVQLVLKLFTHQELERVVNYRCERRNMNFFRFCQIHQRLGRMPSSDSEDGGDSDDAAPPAIRYRRDQGHDMDSSNGSSLPSDLRPPPPEVDELGYPISELPAQPITTFSWRNFFSSINHLRILQKIVKRKAHRQLLMVQFKYSVILKKALKVPQPEIRLYTLKIIKGQVPYCHRKWRSSNMRIITAIYLHCRPELRDEWLAGADVDQEMGDALPLEQALRSLTYWYNIRHYPDSMGSESKKLSENLISEERDFFLRELEKMNLFVEPNLEDDDLDDLDAPPPPLDAY